MSKIVLKKLSWGIGVTLIIPYQLGSLGGKKGNRILEKAETTIPLVSLATNYWSVFGRVLLPAQSYVVPVRIIGIFFLRL